MDKVEQLPEGLGEHGWALWAKLTRDYELRSDEQVLAWEAAATVDEIHALRSELAGLSGKARRPVLTQLRSHRVTLLRLMGQLRLSEDGAPRERRDDVSAKARRAARVRWDGVSYGA